MSSRPELKLDWCSHAAARYAVEHWHYSKTMPAGKMVKIGVWENGAFIGVVLFSRGASPWIGTPYGLRQTQAVELTRIALKGHKSPVSRIVSIAIKLLQTLCVGLRLITSYADPEQGHVGSIYQAMGWVYAGTSSPKWTANGQHNRLFGTSIKRAKSKFGQHCAIVMHRPKYKYLYPLDEEIRQRILPLSKPYPKRPKDSSEPAATHAAEGGAAPTRTLQVFPGRASLLTRRS